MKMESFRQTWTGQTKIRKSWAPVRVKNIYRFWFNVFVKFILSDIDVEAESELLILHVIGRLHRVVAASTVWFGSQLVVVVQKLLRGPSISWCVSVISQYIEWKSKKLCENCGSKSIKLKIAPLSELHDHLADGLPVVCLLVGLVHCRTHCSGTGQAGGGQASSGETHLVRVSGSKKSKKCAIRNA